VKKIEENNIDLKHRPFQLFGITFVRFPFFISHDCMREISGLESGK